jgi:hypothetical protein
MTSSDTAKRNIFSAESTVAAGLLIVAASPCLNWHPETLGADKRQPGYAVALVGESMP